ncbi:MAG: hypothetical protein ACKVQQ_06010 [Burkholderiales bacterium]
MIVLGTRDREEASRVYWELPNGLHYWRGNYIESPPDAQFAPQSFLVRQLPGRTNPSHYHARNQFQLFTDGSGSIGRHEIRPYVVHYAGAYTGYGPIASGPDGINYLTLRAQWDPGAQWLPEKMASLVRGPKLHYSSETLTLLDSSSLLALAAPTMHWVHRDDQHGLGVSQYRLPPHRSLDVPHLARSIGMYLVVLAGAVQHDGVLLERLENIFVSSTEPSYALTTGALPAEVLALEFPDTDPAYASAHLALPGRDTGA